MQPLRTKKSCHLSGQKMRQPVRTKKSCNLSGQKNQASSLDKKITQPLKTKKKIMLSIGPIASKLVHKNLNCFKWHQLCPNRLEQAQMDINWSKLFLGPYGFKWVRRGHKQGSKIGVKNHHELNRMAFKPRSSGSC